MGPDQIRELLEMLRLYGVAKFSHTSADGSVVSVELAQHHPTPGCTGVPSSTGAPTVEAEESEPSRDDVRQDYLDTLMQSSGSGVRVMARRAK